MTKENRMGRFSANRQGGSLQMTDSVFQRLLRYSVINGKLQLYFSISRYPITPLSSAKSNSS